MENKIEMLGFWTLADIEVYVIEIYNSVMQIRCYKIPQLYFIQYKLLILDFPIKYSIKFSIFNIFKWNINSGPINFRDDWAAILSSRWIIQWIQYLTCLILLWSAPASPTASDTRRILSRVFCLRRDAPVKSVTPVCCWWKDGKNCHLGATAIGVT